MIAVPSNVDGRAVARPGAGARAGPDRRGEIDIVLAKLAILAERISPSRVRAPSRHGRGSARSVPGSIFAIADAVAGAARADGDDPAIRMAIDLFAFLHQSKAALTKAFHAEPDLPPEPLHAPDEHRAGEFWRLAALIQDAWEHALEPRVIERDMRLLDLLAGLDWPDMYDFGAGGGYFAFAAARHGALVRCNEINALKRRFLRFRRHAPDRRRGANRIQLGGASEHAQWPASMAIDALDHVSNPVAAIKALSARIRPGGHLLLHAAFPADGWHRSGDELINAVHAALIRKFTIRDADSALTECGVIVLRRRTNAYTEQTTASPSARVYLDPAARLNPEPGGDAVVLAAPRFFARALRLTPDGARLAEACRTGPILAELRREFATDGLSAEVIDDAVEALLKARLATLECAS